MPEPTEPPTQFCPNLGYSTRGQIGQGNIRIHDHQRQRYRCRLCGQTFSHRRGTMIEGLRKPTELIDDEAARLFPLACTPKTFPVLDQAIDDLPSHRHSCRFDQNASLGGIWDRQGRRSIVFDDALDH
ncbi:MAG TPA: hypothetical protein VGM01_06870 [Ktedonobacteraceae bacterium]